MEKKSAILEIVLKYWDDLQQAYQTQFKHFMGVFEFWIAIVGVSTSLCLLVAKDKIIYLYNGNFFVGLLFMLIGFVAGFVTIKMFDIRGSQLRYILKLNTLSKELWERFRIKEVVDIEIPYKNTDINYEAKHDFGMKMAWIMSSINSLIITFGLYLILREQINSNQWICFGILVCVIFVALIFLNKSFYDSLVIKKINK